jgi:hypothetical protein
MLKLQAPATQVGLPNNLKGLIMVEETKQALDVIAVSTGIMSVAAWLPPIASLFTIIWMGIRIWESDTVQGLRGKK